jgi:predicted dehydrogenase
LKDLGPHLIDQAVYLFGFPQSVYADIRTTREHSLVDDWIDILLYYRNTSAQSWFCSRRFRPTLFTVKGSFLKRGDVQEDDLKWAKKNLDSWGTESIEKKGSCMPKLTAK